jgi:hypothetical protein
MHFSDMILTMHFVRESCKSLLTRVGSFLPERTVIAADSAVNYLEVGRWMRQHGYSIGPRLQTLEQVWGRIAEELAGKHRILYLEFGASSGDCIRHWAQLLPGPDCRFVGFDSFEGLPENWSKDYPKGYFSRNGRIPEIDDRRVSFVKGWFHETVPKYALPDHETLIINIDSDLYSSAVCVLHALRNAILPGTYIYFDEFDVRRDELRAFDEFIAETGMGFRCVGATSCLKHVAFQRVT